MTRGTLTAKWRGVTATLSVLLVAGVVPAGPALAAPAADPEFSLLVSPTRLVVTPQTLHAEHHFEVVNNGSAPLDIDVGKRDFVANQAGNMIFQASAPYSASTWVTVEPARFVLAPHTKREVAVHIALPGQAEPGDHQVALVFLVPAADKGDNIRVNRGIGAPILIAVPGPVTDTTVLSSFTGPHFALTGPISFSTTLENTGTVHHDFRGDGHRITVGVAGARIELPDLTVLRGTRRDVTTQWSDPPLWCICHATIALPGQNGAVQQMAVTVVILPLHLLAIAIVLIVLLVIGTRIARRRRQAQIIAAARAMNAAAHGGD